jgi:hypothetical protein
MDDLAMSMDHQKASLLSSSLESGNSGINVTLEPLLDLNGYEKDTDYVVHQMRQVRSVERIVYWTKGEGARTFLVGIAASLNASPHMKDQPFELVFTRIMKMAIEARIMQYDYMEDYDLHSIIMGYADEVATDLLGNFVRSRRWKLYDEPGRMPRPINRATYTGGQNPRGGPFDEFLVGRTTPTVSHAQYQSFMLENNLK